MTLHARDTVTGQLVTLTADPGSADLFAPGPVSSGRYRCMSCGESVGLSRRSGPHSSYAPRFSHGHSSEAQPDGCPARAGVQREVEADLQVVIDLRDHLAKAWPGAHTLIECPEPQLPGEPSPPAVIVATEGGQTIVIECPRGPLDEHGVQRRVNAVRARYGSGAAHVWFFTEDEHHFRQGGLRDKTVWPAGAPASVRHMRVRPTQQHLQIVALGGSVYWINGATVYIPYGGHEHVHAIKAGEDWGGDVAWRRRDWKISHPRPLPGAQWWGLVPIGLSSLRANRVGFHPAEAHEIMERLERSQGARWATARRLARERDEVLRQPPPAEAVPVLTPAPRPVVPPPAPAEPAVTTGALPERPEPVRQPPVIPPVPVHAPYVPPVPLPQPRGPLSRLRQWMQRKR
ncbi:hypothetical protein ACTVZO_41560 [Streptomyces sp. IBSNAI002]|uniref:hypothetical protein n=1 Tax=Streptomyces sp. IBSNAI002 TaxID=3457500 RepID=UPI003FD35B9B